MKWFFRKINKVTCCFSCILSMLLYYTSLVYLFYFPLTVILSRLEFKNVEAVHEDRLSPLWGAWFCR